MNTTRKTPRRATTSLLLALVGCAKEHPPSAAPAATSETAWAPCEASASSDLRFERAPSGTREVTAAWLARNRCGVHIVDVRELDELEEGRIVGTQWVALSDVATMAERWDRSAPIVFVCRSGRRSARAAEQLEALGFRNVASLTGGLREWIARALPTVRGALDGREQGARSITSDAGITQLAQRALASNATPHDRRASGPLALRELQARVARAGAVRWTTAASVLSAGTESCIDGRASEHVLGAPGGDVGELVLALTALERASGATVREASLDAMLLDYADSFGRLYWHSDEHTFSSVARSIADDPRVPREHKPTDARAAIAFVRRPPAGLEEIALDHAARVENVGCGHLRAMLEHPEAYQTRAALVRAVLGAVLRLSWRRPESVDLEVLEGEHHERAVLEVRVERPVHAHTRVPMVSPSAAGGGAFVLHPQVEAWIRSESAEFLAEHAPSLVGTTVELEGYTHEIQSIGAVQVRQTLQRLAAHLPAYEVLFHSDGTASVRLTRRPVVTTATP
ncbi:MAG: rhodanese-like domain-containing protein [Myxococcales bacterium]|nr:rhodanese-like domain-containing protein [Myxococcales bacterium]